RGRRGTARRPARGPVPSGQSQVQSLALLRRVRCGEHGGRKEGGVMGVAILQAVEEVTHITLRDAKPLRPTFRGDARCLLTVGVHTRRGVVSLYLKGARD